jgi:hypothetical protein
MRNVLGVKPSFSVIRSFPHRSASCNLSSHSATKETLRASARHSSANRFIGLLL